MVPDLIYCPYCEIEHVPSKTADNQGNVVGLFCDCERLLIRVNTPCWNGESILPQLNRFLKASVRLNALKKMDNDSIRRLSKKMAYLFLQTKYGKERKLNYAFVEYHTRDIIYKLRESVVSANE